MNFIQEFALLIAVGLPVATIVGYNLVLAALGESGTLLLPSLRPYPALELSAPDALAPAMPAKGDEAANQEFHREAA
jgi:hypothetical protein